MKALNATELIELLPPDDATLNQALQRFEVAAPVLCREPGHCREMIAEGWSQAAQINWNRKPAYVICWRMTFDGGLWIDVAQTLNGPTPFAVLFNAGEQLARAHKARYIRFLTMRRGLVWLAQQHGYQPEALLLTKTL